MLKWIIQKILGTHNARELKRLWPLVAQVNRFEPALQQLSDEQLRAKTDAFRARLRTRLDASPLTRPHTAAWYALNHDERDRLIEPIHFPLDGDRALQPLHRRPERLLVSAS